MSELGKGLKGFKQGLSDEDEAKQQRPPEQQRQIPPQNTRAEPIDITPRTADPVQTPPPADDQPR